MIHLLLVVCCSQLSATTPSTCQEPPAMYFISTKIVDDLKSLTASDEVAEYEVENLQDPLGSFRWRTNGTTAYIEGELDTATALDFWGLWYCNAATQDYARFRTANSQPELLTAPVVDVVDYVRRDPRQGWPFGDSYAFDGTADVDFGNVLNQGALDSFAVSIRFRTESLSAANGLANKSSGPNGWAMFMNVSNQLVSYIHDGGTQTSSVVEALPFLDGLWHEARIEIDRSVEEHRVYVDGVLMDTQDTSAVGAPTSVVPIQVGTGSTNGARWTGELDEFRFWDGTLPTVAESAAGLRGEYNGPIPSALGLYWKANEGVGTIATDETANGFDGTITNGSWQPPYIFTDGFESGDMSGWDQSYHQIGNVPVPVAATWFRIDFNFATNPDGYIEGGELMLAVRLQFAHGQADNWQPVNRSSAVRKSLMAGGNETRGDGANKRDVTFALRGMTKTEAWGQFDPLVRERRNVKPVGVVLDSDDKSDELYPMNYTYYGWLDAVTMSVRANNKPARSVRVREP